MSDDPNPTDAGAQPAAPADAGDPKHTRTFTQADLDRVVAERVRRERAQFGDYADLQAKAAELDRLQEASKSEADKLRERADKATRERDAALERSKATLIRSAIVAQAAKLGAVDPEDVAALLPRDEITLDGDIVEGVEEAVKALLIAKPHLRQQGARTSGAEMRGGQEGTTITQSQHRRWMREGQLTPERAAEVEKAIAEGRYVIGR